MSPDEVERKLRELALPGPSADLDARIERSLASLAAEELAGPHPSDAHPSDAHPSHARATAGVGRSGPIAPLVRLGLVAASLVLAGAGWLGWLPGLGETPAPQRVAVGARMPTFRLPDAHGRVHELDAYRGRIVVIGIGSTRCPWWSGAEVAVRDLEARYADAGVAFIGIAADPRDQSADVVRFAEAAGIDHPVLIDAGGRYAQRLRTEQTPEFYVVDDVGTVVYRGAFDGRVEPGIPSPEEYVERALASLVRGDPIELQETQAVGCPIRGRT